MCAAMGVAGTNLAAQIMQYLSVSYLYTLFAVNSLKTFVMSYL